MRRVLLRLFEAQQRYKFFLQPLDILLAISKSVKNISEILNDVFETCLDTTAAVVKDQGFFPILIGDYQLGGFPSSFSFDFRQGYE